MRISLFALLASLTLAIPAHADVLPSNYSVYEVQNNFGVKIGVLGGASGYATDPGSTAFFLYQVGLNPTTATFRFSQPYFQGAATRPIPEIDFVGQDVADHITSITLDPSSTISGIVASTLIDPGFPRNGLPYPYTYIKFDFTNASTLAGNSAIFDLGFGTAPTPEPSSLLLLATGLLAVGATVRRRLPSASH